MSRGNRLFFQWLIIANLIGLGSLGLYYLGIWDKTNRADVTKLSFLIAAIFYIFTIRIGLHAWRFMKFIRMDETPYFQIGYIEGLLNKQESAWFASDAVLTLGMLGTVLGFIYMLGVSFGNIDPSNQVALRNALRIMGVGMSTALYTTAAGLIGGLILKIQLFLFTRALESYLPPNYCNNKRGC